MNVIYSSDNNYARHVGISITSLYESNQRVKDLTVFLINDNISEENCKKLDEIADQYGRKIEYISFQNYKERLRLNNKWELPISAYARLFIEEMVPKDVDRILYLDCDTVICDDLTDLWTADLHGNTIGAVEDVASCVFQAETGVQQAFRYFCSGVLLIDLEKWRRIHAQEMLMKYLDDRKGIVRHHDQTILNGVFWNDCFILHPRYDALTPTFIMPYANLKAYFRLWDQYYSRDEIKESIKHPAIIHYTASNVGRPWENSKHPFAKLYQTYWKASAWRDIPLSGFQSTFDKKQQRVYWMYQHIPVRLIRLFAQMKSSIKRRG